MAAPKPDPVRATRLTLKPTDVIPTGNEWLSLPAIRVADGAIESMNVLHEASRGLLQVDGPKGTPLLTPFASVDGEPVKFTGFQWEVLGSWVPRGTMRAGDLTLTLTYCAPPGSRAGFIRMEVANRGKQSRNIVLALHAAWAGLTRVTYAPVPLTGRRIVKDAPWVDDAVAFSFMTHDSLFSWSLMCPGGHLETGEHPDGQLTTEATRQYTLKPGGRAEALFLVGVGVEEFSSSQSAKVLHGNIDRRTIPGMIDEVASWCQARTKRVADAALETVMNRNFLFNAFFAWGRAIDTEQFVGATSRSPRYYVCAAYWDRDGMIWSFPALLDIDHAMARQALEYALTTQLANTGVHSRYIDGTVLEDGYQLDEGAAPIIALAAYAETTRDHAFVTRHREAVERLDAMLAARYDPEVGLFSTLQDSQDEYIKQPFGTLLNTMAWKALLSLSALYKILGEQRRSTALARLAVSVRGSILKHCIVTGAPGAGGPIFARATDGKTPLFNDVPPGSLCKLPLLGLVPETDKVWNRTMDWLNSKHYKYSNHGKAYGLPGSFRVDFTCCWNVGEYLRLSRGKERALKVLRKATWDGGIVSEGLDPATAEGVGGGGAFAAAAGYVAHSIYHALGSATSTPRKKKSSR